MPVYFYPKENHKWSNAVDDKTITYAEYHKLRANEVQSQSNLLRLSSSTLPSVETIPSTSLVNWRWEAWGPCRAFNWHKIPAADFSCCRISSVVWSSVWSWEWFSISIFGVLEPWCLPKVTKMKLVVNTNMESKSQSLRHLKIWT